MSRVFVVLGYDVGGNSGTVVIRVFANECVAKHYAVNAKARSRNNAFSDEHPAFDVEEHDLVSSLDEVREELAS